MSETLTRLRRIGTLDDETFEERMCKRKKRYKTEMKARKVARTCKRKHGSDLNIYHCPYCDGYHLTKAET